jgi:hypothetical protein
MKKAVFLIFVSLAAAVNAADHSRPPVNDAIILTRATLSRLELTTPVSRTAGLLPEKKDRLPLSVGLYLKPSGQLDSLRASVQKVARAVRTQVAPGSKQKNRLRDSQAVAAAVWAYLNENLPVDPSVNLGAQASTDWRLAWPKASEILASGKADADGRALVEVALLRALKIPARTAWAQGRLVSQYWVALAEDASPKKTSGGKSKAKKASAPKPPLGFWALLDPSLQDLDVEAWSLDNGALMRLHWAPEQELSVTRSGWQRRVYAAGDSLTAKAALDYFNLNGHLPQVVTTSADVGLSATPAVDLSGEGTFYVLTQESFHLETEGSMAYAESVDLLSPYRPQLPQWGRECTPRVRALELEAQALWSDRPERVRLRSGDKPRDEWQSPPPALGVLHYLSFGLRRPGSVLQAARSATQVTGVLLRANNLSPREGWPLQLNAQGISLPSQTLALPADGHFCLTLTAEEQAVPVLELRTKGEAGDPSSGDMQRLLIP